jgi:hypothetical protein
MADDLILLRALVACVRARLERARRDEVGALSLEWVAVILGILTVAGVVVAVVVQRATAAANKITIP